MGGQRFLGGAWATIHAPREPHALLTWVLDAGFAGLVAGPGPRATDWAGLRGALGELPASVPAVRVDGLHETRRSDAGIASSRAADREAAMASIEASVALGNALACRRVVLEPGAIQGVVDDGRTTDLADASANWTPDRARAARAQRNARLDAGLDAACRFLFAACKRFPDVEFCLTPSRFANGIGDAEGLAAILEDLAAYRLAYWHDPAVAACREELLDEPQGGWLERLAPNMVGITLADAGGGVIYLPPGAGRVDYALLASYRRRQAGAPLAAVELDPGVEPSELPGIHAFLDKFHL